MTAPLSPLTPAIPPLALTPSAAGAASTAAASAGDNYTDLKGLAALKNSPNSPAAIHAVSQQVEALFLQMMLKSMREASESDGELDSNETSMYEDMFDKQVALTLSKHQDLGIARLFERQLGAKEAGAPAATRGAASPSRDPVPLQVEPKPTRPQSTAEDGSQNSAASPDLTERAAQFVRQVFPTIRRAASGLGINPLGLLAQAALETGWGQRMPRTANGTPSLNMFGIKAGEEWTGAKAIADTVEFNGGVAMQRRTAFRAYASIQESVNDFASLLVSSPRYRGAIADGADAQAYIHNLAKSGYATDPEYGNKLNQILNGNTLRRALKSAVASL